MSLLVSLRDRHHAGAIWQRLQPIIRDALLYRVAPPPDAMALAYHHAYMLANCSRIDGFPAEWAAMLLPPQSSSQASSSSSSQPGGANGYRGGGPGLILLQTLLVQELRDFIFADGGAWQAMCRATANINVDPRQTVVEFVSRHKALIETLSILEAVLPPTGWYSTAELEAIHHCEQQQQQQQQQQQMNADTAGGCTGWGSGGTFASSSSPPGQRQNQHQQQQQHQDPAYMHNKLMSQMFPPPSFLAPLTLREVILREWCDLVVQPMQQKLFDAGAWMMHKIRRHHHRPKQPAGAPPPPRPNPEVEERHEAERCALLADLMQTLRDVQGTEHREQAHFHHSSVTQVLRQRRQQKQQLAAVQQLPTFPSHAATAAFAPSQQQQQQQQQQNHNPFSVVASATAAATAAPSGMGSTQGSFTDTPGSVIASGRTPGDMTAMIAQRAAGYGPQQSVAPSTTTTTNNNTPTPPSMSLPRVPRQPLPPRSFYDEFKGLAHHAFCISLGQYLELQANKMRNSKNKCDIKTRALQQQIQQLLAMQEQEEQLASTAATATSSSRGSNNNTNNNENSQRRLRSIELAQQQLAQAESQHAHSVMEVVRGLNNEMLRDAARYRHIFHEAILVKDYRREMSALLDRHCTPLMLPVFAVKLRARDADAVALLAQLALRLSSSALLKQFHAQLSAAAFREVGAVVRECKEALAVATPQTAAMLLAPATAELAGHVVRAGLRFTQRLYAVVTELEALCRQAAHGDGSALLAVDCGVVAALSSSGQALPPLPSSSSSTPSLSQLVAGESTGDKITSLPPSRILAVLLAFIAGLVVRNKLSLCSAVAPSNGDVQAARDSIGFEKDCEMIAVAYRYIPDKDIFCSEFCAGMANRVVAPSSAAVGAAFLAPALRGESGWSPHLHRDWWMVERLCSADPFASKELRHKLQLIQHDARRGDAYSAAAAQQRRRIDGDGDASNAAVEAEAEKEDAAAAASSSSSSGSEVPTTVSLLAQTLCPAQCTMLSAALTAHEQCSAKRSPASSPQGRLPDASSSPSFSAAAASDGTVVALPLFSGALLSPCRAVLSRFEAAAKAANVKWALTWSPAASRVEMLVHPSAHSGGCSGCHAAAHGAAAVPICVTAVQARLLLLLTSCAAAGFAMPLHEIVFGAAAAAAEPSESAGGGGGGAKQRSGSSKLLAFVRDQVVPPLARAGLVRVASTAAPSSSSTAAGAIVALASSDSFFQRRRDGDSLDIFSDTIDPLPEVFAAMLRSAQNNVNNNNKRKGGAAAAAGVSAAAAAALSGKTRDMRRERQDPQNVRSRGFDNDDDDDVVAMNGDDTAATAAMHDGESDDEDDEEDQSATLARLNAVMQSRGVAIQGAIMQVLKRQSAPRTLLEICEAMRESVAPKSSNTTTTASGAISAASLLSSDGGGASAPPVSPLAVLSQRYGFVPGVVDIKAQLDLLVQRSYVRHERRVVSVPAVVAADGADSDSAGVVESSVDVYVFEP